MDGNEVGRKACVFLDGERSNLSREGEAGDLNRAAAMASKVMANIGDKVFGDIGASQELVVLVEPDVPGIEGDIGGQQSDRETLAHDHTIKGHGQDERDAETGNIDVAAGDAGLVGDEGVWSERQGNPKKREGEEPAVNLMADEKQVE